MGAVWCSGNTTQVEFVNRDSFVDRGPRYSAGSSLAGAASTGYETCRVELFICIDFCSGHERKARDGESKGAVMGAAGLRGAYPDA